jgi:hypothetical protein
LKSDTLLISLGQSLQFSTMSIQDTRLSSCALCGLMFVRKSRQNTWFILKSKWSMLEFKGSMTS